MLGHRSAALWLTLLLAIGCGGTPRAAPAPETRQSAWTGDVSEESFRRLHELSAEQAPPPRGEGVDLGGSRGYLSLPEGEARAAVIVIHEWWGLNDHVRHWTDRLAAEGYAALGVDLYGGQVATTPERAMELMRQVDDGAALEVVRSAVAFLDTDPRVAATERRGIIGWCFGGGWSLESALRLDGFAAVVMYYGRPVTDVERLRGLDGPLLGIFGTEDESIPPARVDELERALEEAGVEHTILRFDAPHAFANPSSGRYHAEAAGRAWAAVREHLARTLRGEAPGAREGG
jgi:carboxymethylenebutenolidase